MPLDKRMYRETTTQEFPGSHVRTRYVVDDVQVAERVQEKEPLLKRPFDILLSGIGLIVSAWLWVIIWLAIMIEDGFPVIIRQDRIGKYGKLFRNYKFRSMVKSTLKEKVNIQATENDIRVTKVGRILRKCALDELPQLINIFLGQMSFVGPRALLPEEKEVHSFGNTYTNGGTLAIAEIPGYAKRITVQPGLTGIAQIWAPRDIPRRHKFKYDLLYIRKRAFWFDLKLIFISFLVTFRSNWETRAAKIGILERYQEPSWAVSWKPLIINWLPFIAFLVLIFPAFNIFDKYICTWNNFRVFGDSIRLIVPETPLYVLNTLWAIVRELSHFVVYAILTFLLFRGFRVNVKRLSLKNFVYPGLVAICFSFADELAQSFMANRGASITDCVVDGFAILFVLLLLYRKYRTSIVKEHPGLEWAERPIWNTNSIKKYANSWLPVVAYLGVLFVAGNILLTNENTLCIINQVTALWLPDTNHATMCMIVGKTRDWSHILIYAVFTYLVFCAIKNTCKKTMLYYVVMAGICALGFGTFDEVTQMLMAGRSASITDWFINILGVAFGIGLIFMTKYRANISNT
jgi:lipopolysaccharide/colanic/teichoic acid biosynthesis glycosyltransferase/VanZ family protein